VFTPLELSCCGLAEEEAVAQIGEESVVYLQNLIWRYYKQYFEIYELHSNFEMK
jgi:hypothetical protein